MFSRHVTKYLSAYCQGELMPDESRRLAEHLIACGSCRQELDKIRLGIKFAEQLPQFSAPDSLWLELEGLCAVQRENYGPLRTTSFISHRRSAQLGIAAVVVLAAVAVGSIYILRNRAKPSWEVARIDGSPRVGSSRLTGTGRLVVGQWLETDGSSRAQINVSSIGQVEIDPNTRVRLLQTQPSEHRLELARGKMSARIWAPPRLFFVDTPSAVAADLGCAYTLEVNDSGESLLHVTVGWVALELKDREAMVPAGAACETRPGIGPGTPYFEDASEPFRRALAKFDFSQADVSSSLKQILSEARARDSLTLWHLLSRAQGNDRGAVFDRLSILSVPPAGVTREGIMQLNPTMLELWKNDLANTWTGASDAPGKDLKLVK